jgi:hypothetical protein
MAREVRNFAVSVPAGTAQASPQTTDLTMPARIVRAVRVRVPPGPAGVMGWALAASGVNIIPWASGQWMVMDDEAIEWPLESQIESGAWQLRAYNTGVYAHSLYVTFLVDPLGASGGPIIVTSPVEVSP